MVSHSFSTNTNIDRRIAICCWARPERFLGALGSAWAPALRFENVFSPSGIDFGGFGEGLGEVLESFFDGFCVRRRDVERRRQTFKNL